MMKQNSTTLFSVLLLLLSGVLLWQFYRQGIPGKDSSGLKYRDTTCNFGVALPGGGWHFSQDSPCMGLRKTAPDGFDSRIQIFVHDWKNRETATDCTALRPQARTYVDTKAGKKGAGIQWTGQASPDYGFISEACEEEGFATTPQGRLNVRTIALPVGTQQYSFILISSPHSWVEDNKALEEVVYSFRRTHPERIVLPLLAVIFCGASLVLLRRRKHEGKL